MLLNYHWSFALFSSAQISSRTNIFPEGINIKPKNSQVTHKKTCNKD